MERSSGNVKFIPGLVSVTFKTKSADDIVELCRNAGLKTIEWSEGWHIPDRSELQALAESPNRPDDFFCIAGFCTVTDFGESRYGDSKKSMLIGVASSSTHCDVLSFTTTTEPILTSMSTRYGMSLRCVKD